MGFGAERAALMQDQNISVPTQDYEETKVDSGDAGTGDNKIVSEAVQAKNKLLQEINAFADAPEMTAATGA